MSKHIIQSSSHASLNRTRYFGMQLKCLLTFARTYTVNRQGKKKYESYGMILFPLIRDCDVYCLLQGDFLQFGRYLATFRRNVLPLSLV
jgi:hypothetical protein